MTSPTVQCLHDLARAQLGRLGHGQLLVRPRRGDHARHAVLRCADRAVDHVADRVDQANRKRRRAVRRDLDGLLGDEFRLGGHDRLARAALRQLVAGALALIKILDVRDDQLLHQALDKGRFARSHRPDHPDVNIAARPAGNVGVDVAHIDPPSDKSGRLRLPRPTVSC